MTDVLVIGGGMAGVMAALSAKAAGAQVLVARRSYGGTAVSSGAIDVAPDPSAPGGDLKAHLIAPLEAAREVARTRPNHPYAVLRQQLDLLPEALAFAAAQLPELLSPPQARNVLLPTPLGTVKPTAMAQRSQLGADLSRLPEHVAVVQLSIYPAYDARLVASGLERAAQGLGRSLRASVVQSAYFHRIEDALRQPHELAEALEAPAALEAFAADLKRLLPQGVGAVLLPPVFGRRVRGLVDRLGGLLGVPCAELLSAAPSVPGLRLQEALDGALERAGIELLEEEVHGERATEGVFLAGQRQVTPRSVVLATGKFIGGGIVRDKRFREAVLNLPVYAGGRRVRDEYIGELLADTVQGDQPAFRAGVRIDAALRPLGLDGMPVHPRLFAAGAVISGYDPAADKTGLGVALFTGYLAGREAAGRTPTP